MPAIAGSVRGVKARTDRVLQVSDINSTHTVRSAGHSVSPAVSTGGCTSTAPAAFDRRKPLLFLYDCETTGLNCYCDHDHIIEIASIVLVPDNAPASITTSEFSSLCHTSRRSNPGGEYKAI